MTSVLRDFIEQRMREITAAEEPLQQQIWNIKAQLEALSAERGELYQAGAAIGMFDGSSPSETPPAEASRPAEAGRTSSPTIKEAILAVMDGAEYPIGAHEILFEMNRRFEWSVPRTSLSPQLSRLKAEGKIILEGRQWRLAQEGEQNTEASDQEPERSQSEASQEGAPDPERPAEPVESGREVVPEKSLELTVFD